MPDAKKPRLKANWFDLRKLDDRLYGIAEPGHSEEVNSYIVLDDTDAVLIDSGMGLFSVRKRLDHLVAGRCRVLNTHSHFDHIGGNHELDEAALLDHPRSREAAAHGIDSQALVRFTEPAKFWGKVPEGIPHPYRIRPFPRATFFRDNEVLRCGALEIRALACPGHSDDSACFYLEEEGFLFAGDLLYDGPIFIEKAGGLEKFRYSLERISSLDGLTRIFAGHNDFEFPRELLDQLRNTLDRQTQQELDREMAIRGRLRLIPY